ncbi:NAD(P)-dependent oxidoreductase [Chloroflexota bacterium]
MASPRWKVWLVVYWPERKDIIQGLEAAGCEVILGRSLLDSKHYTEDELVERVADIDGLMVATGELITRRVMEAGKKLKVISKVGRGVELIDVSAATDLGILVTNTVTELNTISTAEYAVAMILAMAKKFKLADHNARLGLWRSVSNILLRNKTVGIVGLGRIGSKVAQLLQPFEVRLLACSPHASSEKARMLRIELTDMETLLKESDFVTLHAVQNEETRGLIGEVQLRLMKPTAYIINTARGGLIDGPVLAGVLRDGQIAGAALDVFEPEVPQAVHSLLDEDFYFQTLYSSHVAGLNPENDWNIAIVQMENCINALNGEIPESVVNPKVLPKWQEGLKGTK